MRPDGVFSDSPGQGILICTDKRLLLVNEACVEMLGFDSTQEMMASRKASEVFWPEERARVCRGVSAAMRGRAAPRGLETRCLRRDGAAVLVLAVIQRVEWQGEAAVRIQLTGLPGQGNFAEKLVRGERDYRDMIEELPLGICIHQHLTPVFVNQAYARIFGYENSAEVMSLGSVVKLLLPEERERLHGYRVARMRGEAAPSQFDFEGIRKDGTVITCSTMVRVIEWNGEPAIQHTIIDISERERARREIEESDTRFRGLIEGSVQGISIRNSKRRLLVNEAFARIFGYGSAAEVMAEKTARPVSAPNDRERILGIHHAVLQGRQGPAQFEFEAVRRDGSRIWLNAISSRVEWEGRPAVQTACTDITHRKLAEESLRASERRYRELIEGSVQGINIRGAEGRLLVNEAFARMFGYETDEFMNLKEPFTRVAAHDKEKVRAVYESMLRRRQPPKHFEFEGVRKDGSTIWLSAFARRIEWDGKPAVQITYSDITESKLAEDRLRSSEELYRELFEGSVQGILIRTDKPRLANETLASIFGYDSVKEIMKLPPYYLAAAHERERLKYYRNARMRGDLVPAHYEMEGVKKDGTPIWLSVAARLIRWNGELAIQSAFTDITQRKRTEAELLDAKMESIGAMARGIAGEFNSIYTSILNALSAAKMEAYAVGQTGIVEILAEAERTSIGARSVIQDLMVLNRAGEPVKEPVGVEEVLKEALPLLGTEANVVPLRPNKIRINLDLAGDLWAVGVDRLQVKQALGFLIANGIQAMPAGGVLGISAENEEVDKIDRALNLGPGRYVKITIRNQGPRIPAALLKNIFDPYFSGTRSNPNLGMANAFSIVRQHGGTIRVSSTARGGNRFHVFLPVQAEKRPRGKRPSGKPPQQRRRLL